MTDDAEDSLSAAPDARFFSYVTSLDEIAEMLDVPTGALFCVEIEKGVTCGVEDCQYPAVSRNTAHNRHSTGPRCVVHRQTWFPKESSVRNVGFSLLGPQYLRADDRKHPCFCGKKICRGIGYSPYMARVSPDHDIIEKVITALGIHDAEKRKKIRETPRNCRIGPWHFDPKHRELEEETGTWRLLPYDETSVFHDKDRKKWTGFPPANYLPSDFIDEDVNNDNRRSLPRDRWVEKFGSAWPAWVLEYARVEQPIELVAAMEPAVTPARSDVDTPRASSCALRALWDVRESAAAGSGQRGRHGGFGHVTPVGELLAQDMNEERYLKAMEDRIELQDDLDRMRRLCDKLKRSLDDEKKTTQHLRLVIKEKDGEIVSLKSTVAEQDCKIKILQRRLQNYKNLSYQDLKPGGRLGNFVSDYTFHRTYRANEAFLQVINWDDEAQGCAPGDGIAVGLRRYSKVKASERDGHTEPPAHAKTRPHLRQLHWKTEYFIFCVYCRVGLTQRQIAALFGLETAQVVSDIIYAWANVLDDALSTLFPTPTRSQLLRAYPSRFIRAFGHARTFMLLDATEVWTEIAHHAQAHASMFSEYKHHDTIKYLAGCDPIGCAFDGALPKDGFCGSISDAIATDKSSILNCIPFGMAVEVDKGFLIDNLCALLGIGCLRPQKKLKLQTQQGSEDTSLTQKIGNTRIIIEQVNGGAKMQGRYFNGVVPILQLGLAPILLRVCFLMQNFKPAFIHGTRIVDKVHDGTADSYSGARKLRPSRGEVRWYGASDQGLVDVRGRVELWGTRAEEERFKQLQELHPTKTEIEIGEMVLSENIPAQLRAQHIQYINNLH